jgi:membrane protease YdiL (CAAX protease family)
VENSSAFATLPDSPIVFPPDGFRWYWTILFLIGIVVVFLAVMIAGMIWYMASHGLDIYATARAMSGMPGVTVQGIAELFAVAFIAILLPVLARTPPAGIGFRGISGAQIGTAALGVVLMFVLVSLLSSGISTLLHYKSQEAAIAMYEHATGWQRAAFAFFGILVAPAFEEGVFRYVLFNAMRHWWGVWAGAAISSILFGLAHLQPDAHNHFTGPMFASITLPLAVGGLVLCWVYAKTNNAWASYITHGTFNGITFILLSVAPQLAK